MTEDLTLRERLWEQVTITNLNLTGKLSLFGVELKIDHTLTQNVIATSPLSYYSSSRSSSLETLSSEYSDSGFNDVIVHDSSVISFVVYPILISLGLELTDMTK